MDELAAKLAELADKFGVSVEYLWPLLVKKVVIDWWVGTGICVLFTIVSFILYKKTSSKPDWGVVNADGDPSGQGFFTVVVFAGMLLMAIIFFLAQICTISTLFVPEATVIQQLL